MVIVLMLGKWEMKPILLMILEVYPMSQKIMENFLTLKQRYLVAIVREILTKKIKILGFYALHEPIKKSTEIVASYEKDY